eukprot:105306_1
MSSLLVVFIILNDVMGHDGHQITNTTITYPTSLSLSNGMRGNENSTGFSVHNNDWFNPYLVAVYIGLFVIVIAVVVSVLLCCCLVKKDYKLQEMIQSDLRTMEYINKNMQRMNMKRTSHVKHIKLPSHTKENKNRMHSIAAFVSALSSPRMDDNNRLQESNNQWLEICTVIDSSVSDASNQSPVQIGESVPRVRSIPFGENDEDQTTLFGVANDEFVVGCLSDDEDYTETKREDDKHQNTVQKVFTDYITTYGYPPKKADHLIAFAKTRNIKIKFVDARALIESSMNQINNVDHVDARDSIFSVSEIQYEGLRMKHRNKSLLSPSVEEERNTNDCFQFQAQIRQVSI